MPDELDLARRVARAVDAAGGRALVVGGWVRDRLRGAPSHDIDLEVHGLPAERLRGVLAELAAVNTVGASFAVFKLGAPRHRAPPHGVEVRARPPRLPA